MVAVLCFVGERVREGESEVEWNIYDVTVAILVRQNVATLWWRVRERHTEVMRELNMRFLTGLSLSLLW